VTGAVCCFWVARSSQLGERVAFMTQVVCGKLQTAFYSYSGIGRLLCYLISLADFVAELEPYPSRASVYLVEIKLAI
jgi:hypothetical protein